MSKNKIEIKSIVKQVAIGSISCALALVWCIDNPYIKFPMMAIPTISMLLAFIIIFFEPDFLTPTYSIFQSIINSILFIGAYCVILVGEYSPTASLPSHITFPAKVFLYLAIPFYYERISNSYSINFLPFGAIIGSLLSSYLYFKFANPGILFVVVIMTQILFNVFVFPPVHVNQYKSHQKTE